MHTQHWDNDSFVPQILHETLHAVAESTSTGVEAFISTVQTVGAKGLEPLTPSL